MDEDDGLNRDWRRLMVEPIREVVVLLMRNELAYVWDGWHRVVAAIATGRAVKAIVGRPHASRG